MIQDHTPLEVNTFGGLFGRDSFTDSVPADHFIDCQNTITEGFELRSRDGFPACNIAMDVRRFHTYKIEGQADRTLILVVTPGADPTPTQGKIYDSAISLTAPIMTVNYMTDFSVCQAYNRIYISPHNGVKGLPGESVWVYDGDGVAQLAGGLAPVGDFVVAISATAGNVEKGTHVLAFVFQTEFGFVTAPGPAVFQKIDAPGDKKLSISSIPIGPPGVTQRRLISTRAIEDYNGDQEGYEYFFVPGGTINDNTTTTLEIDYFDAALETSVDYLFDQLARIPACLWMAPYRKRIAYGGEDANPSMVRFSKSDEPESVDSLSGFIICDPNETVGVKAGIEYRDNFYIFKGVIPGHTYTTKDNTYEPSTWPIITLDRGIGCDLNGSSQYMDAKGANSDFFLVADAAGLYAYNGGFDATNPLSGKITNLWERINKKAFNRLQLVIDPKKLLIYVLVPLDNALEPTHVIVCNYENGLTADLVSWHLWTISGNINPLSIGVWGSTLNGRTILRLGGPLGIFQQEPNNYHDNGNAYASIVQFAMLYTQSGWIHAFNALRLRCGGSGNMAVIATGLDNSPSINLPSMNLASGAGVERIFPFLLTNEKCSIKLRLTAYNNWFKIRKVELFARPLWATRHNE
jgi:hypothetical protein